MDVNPSNLETSENMITWGSSLDQNIVETKSFRCTFCKRGFSNAQALGGHMNIHRKDRAKLKEFSCENLLSLDIAKNEDSPPPDSSAAKRLSSENDHSPDDKSENLDHVEENPVRQLPFFAEAPPVNGGGEDEAGGGSFDKHVEGGKVELIHYGELDLELRLGPEPRHAKSKP